MSFHKENLIQSTRGDIKSFYRFEGKSLGEGSYGIARRAKRMIDGEDFAIKIIPKRRIQNEETTAREIVLMKETDHPNIVRLNETFEDKKYIYLVMDLCRGGELFDVLTSIGHFSERRTVQIFSQMLSAVTYLHSLGIVHRDLKPENFLFSEVDVNAPLKLIDFGIARKINPEHCLKTKTGTCYYMSPEVLNGNYDEKCDVWSLGVILFMMLSGYPPFDGPTNAKILKQIRKAKFEFDDEIWDHVSQGAKGLISLMLHPDPSLRISAEEALQHWWIRSYEDIEHVPIQFDYTKLEEYQRSNRFRKAVLNYMATQCSTQELTDLIKLFNDIDTHNTGFITIEEMRHALVSIHFPSEQLDQEIHKIFQDTQKIINLTEFVAAMLDRRVYLREEKLWQAFLRFDTHHTGKITPEELGEVLGVDDIEVWKKMIQEADIDGDGKISYLEFIYMMETF